MRCEPGSEGTTPGRLDKGNVSTIYQALYNVFPTGLLYSLAMIKRL
jgi:hypothetical protein